MLCWLLRMKFSSRNYQVERNFMEPVGQGECVPLFKREEIEINQTPRIDNAAVRELGMNTIGARMRLRDAAQNYLRVQARDGRSRCWTARR